MTNHDARIEVAPLPPSLLPTDQIEVGERSRQNPEVEIDALIESIKEVGQIQPIIIDLDSKLIAGARRLRACEKLGRDVMVLQVERIDEIIALQIERDENVCRVPLTKSEAARLGMKLEKLERERALARQRAGKPSSESDEPGRTDSKVAEAIGLSRDSYRKVKKVLDKGCPELIGAMDTGAISLNRAARIADLDKDRQATVVSVFPDIAEEYQYERQQAGPRCGNTVLRHVPASIDDPLREALMAFEKLDERQRRRFARVIKMNGY